MRMVAATGARSRRALPTPAPLASFAAVGLGLRIMDDSTVIGAFGEEGAMRLRAGA
jgi:hypothetical protein